MSAINYVDDSRSATVQQLFIPVCMPRTPNIRRGPDTGPDENISLYTCEDCSEKFVFQSTFKFHKDRLSVEIRYHCRKCFRLLVFYNRCNFLTHLHQHNLDLNEVELRTLEVSTRPIPMNMMPYFTLTEYQEANDPKAISGASQNSQVCSACPECKVNLACTLKEHFNNPRINENVWHTCSTCNLILPTKCSLKAHLRIHTKLGTLMCPECCISFPNWDSFWEHISNVCYHRHKIVKHQCHKCSLIFEDYDMLEDHFLSHHLPLCKAVQRPGRIRKTCDFCGDDVPQGHIKTHVLSHAIEKSASFVVYSCPSTKCSVICEEFKVFKRHVTSCLLLRINFTKAAKNSSNSLPISQQKNESETTNGSTKQALDLLKSKGNVAVHRIESKRDYRAHEPPASSGGFRSVVRMPLTPSPEPLSEGSGQGHYKDKHQTGQSSPQVNKTTPCPGESLLMPRLGDTSSLKLMARNHSNDAPVNKADVLVVKMHQCTICRELIVYDRKSDALKMHFKNKHKGRYKLGKIKPVGVVDSNTSVSGSDREDAPPLLKKQEPLAISPRRLKEAAVRKEMENGKKPSVLDSDDECLLSVKNRTMEMQSIGTGRTLLNNISHVKTPEKISAASVDVKPGTVGNDLQSDSSSDSGPVYKRKRRRGSSSDPDFECSELFSSPSQAKEKHKVLRRRRTLDRSGTSTTNQDSQTEFTTPPKKHNGSLKKRRVAQEQKQKSPHSHDSKAYFSNVVNEYKEMGSGIVIPTEDLPSKNTFNCLQPDCEFASNDSEAFRDHIKTHRTDDNTFQCMECGICFVVKPTFAKHLIINHSIKDIDAYIKENDCCDKELINLNIKQLEKRLEQQKAENVPMVLLENQCKICYQVCEDSLGLKKHFRIHGMAFLQMNQTERCK